MNPDFDWAAFWVGWCCGVLVLTAGWVLGFRSRRALVFQDRRERPWPCAGRDDGPGDGETDGGADPIDVAVDDAIGGHLARGPRRKGGGP